MDKKYNVTNRSSTQVVYSIPELNLHRDFMPGETKKISYDELEKLSYRPGGAYVLANYLQVQEEEALNKLNMETELEYHMSVEEITELLKNGTIEQFLDCLDFAPVGVIDIIKDLSIKLPLNDVAKREAILAKTGFDVSKAIENSKVEKTEDKADAPKRRVTAPAQSATRRVAAPASTKEPFEKYKNVTILED